MKNHRRGGSDLAVSERASRIAQGLTGRQDGQGRPVVKNLAARRSDTPPALRRRPQAERSADTRHRLVEAAISSLHRVGYSATTVAGVALEAGVSRGAMTHQFPAKTDLMLQVVSAVFRKDALHYQRSLAAVSPVEWMKTLPSTMWEVISQPSGVAVMEIMLASRSDPDLARKLRGIQETIDVEAFAWAKVRRRDAGLMERPDADAVHRLFVAAVRGLALEALFMDNRAEVERSIAILAEILRQLYPALA